MLGTYLNCLMVLAGSGLGLLLRGRVSPRVSQVLTAALALCVMGIGISSAIRTEDTLCVIVCMVLGTLIGVALRIEHRLDQAGDWLKGKLMKPGGTSQFTEGFVTASLLYCVGSMAVMGALEAGIRGDYSILISKGVIDGVTAISFAATMGVGVAFSALPLLVYEGALTLLAEWVGPLLSDAAVREMSAVGGLLILGIGINMMDPKRRIPVGDMLPAIFLPLGYLPLAHWLGALL